MTQLTSQKALDEFGVIEAESNLKNYIRQLKELLQIANNEKFDIVIPNTTNEITTELIPDIDDVFTASVAQRPEVQSALLGISKIT